MEFIIWGAGARGRRLRRYLREEKVIAYIDARKDLHGTIYDGIPVINFSDYLIVGLSTDEFNANMKKICYFNYEQRKNL